MEKEKLSTDLKTLAGQTSHSQQTWDSYIDNVVIPFAPKEEDKLPEYLKRHAEYLKTQNGQYGKDIADLTNTQVSAKVEEFKKNYKLEQPKPAPTPPAQPQSVINQNDEISKKLKELDDFKKTLEDRYANEVKVAQRESLIADAKKKATEQGATDETVLSFILPLINPTDKDSVDTLSASIKSKYDEAYTKLKGGGYSPASGSGSHNNKANTAALNAFKEQMIKEGKLPSKNTN